MIEPEIKTEFPQNWKYETDLMDGICIIAKDKMQIKFVFECFSDKFYDVLKIDKEIKALLETPVSVEGMADSLHKLFPNAQIICSGRAESHGWITSVIGEWNETL